MGVVSRINIRATTFTSFDRLENIMPNKNLITKAVTNWTLSDNTTRIIIKIGVAYGSDIDQVRQILIGLAGQQPEILKDPAPSVFFMEHGDSTLNFDLRFFVADLSSRLPLTDRMNTLINKELNAKGIIIAFPQRDINIKMEDIQEIVKKVSPFLSQQNGKNK
jgi:potassium-dependent mechanosensitive channel